MLSILSPKSSQKSFSMTNDTKNEYKCLKINFPYFLYPGTPFAGYYSESYNSELIRLIENIINLRDNQSKPFLFHITIGAPMEEIDLNVLKSKKCFFQLHQLVPDHLIRAAQNGIKVINFIVCPNIIEMPLFMIFTDDFVKLSDKSYKHFLLPIEIQIFNTMMPTKDDTRNKKFITQCEKNHTEPLFQKSANLYFQNPDDHIFVDVFYNELKKSVENITNRGNFCSCFSFAVFNEKTQFRDIKNFLMFKEILDCYTDPTKTIICEWMFSLELSVVFNMNKTNVNSICYVPPNKLNNLTLTLHILIPNVDKNGNIVCEFKSVKNFLIEMKTSNLSKINTRRNILSI